MKVRGVALAVALVVLAGCAGSRAASTPAGEPAAGVGTAVASAAPVTTPLPTPSAEPFTSPAVPTCEALAASMAAPDRIGQLFMVGLSSTVAPATAAKTVQSTRAGTVILLGNSQAGAVRTAAIGAAIRAVSPGTIVAVDQEGGSVQRLQGPGFDRIPNAMTQAKLPSATLQAQATTWGQQLRAAGVVYDLAPVADVVPASANGTNAPIGLLKRGYGNDPTTAATSVVSFLAGMRAAGVATSLKHFPGLGYATGNTDFSVAVDTVTTREKVPATFRAGIAAGADSVMISSVAYSKIDPRVPGVFSSVIITGMLRGDLGYHGVVISDDLGSAQAVASVPAGERALRFLAAGGDLVVNANPAIQSAMTTAVTQRAAADAGFAAGVTQSAARVLRLKASVGAVSCR